MKTNLSYQILDYRWPPDDQEGDYEEALTKSQLLKLK